MTSSVYDMVMAASMAVGRGRLARVIADIGEVGPADNVVDIGCGPGTAVREAARRGAAATGIDPSPVMLKLARRVSAFRRAGNVSWLEGGAEQLPVPDGQATLVWSVASLHHWSDRAAGLSEACRALAPEGRLILADWLVRPGTRGHSAHGVTSKEAGEVAGELSDAGFGDVRVSTQRVGRRTLQVIKVAKASASH